MENVNIRVLYLCDHKKCKRCDPIGECNHTSDTAFAISKDCLLSIKDFDIEIMPNSNGCTVIYLKQKEKHSSLIPKVTRQHCPYCDQEFHFTGNRRLEQRQFGSCKITCRKCKKDFWVAFYGGISNKPIYIQ